MLFFENGGWLWGKLPVVDANIAGRHPVEIGVGCFEEEGLAMVIEGGAPRVRDRDAGGPLEVVTLRAVAKEAAI